MSEDLPAGRVHQEHPLSSSETLPKRHAPAAGSMYTTDTGLSSHMERNVWRLVAAEPHRSARHTQEPSDTW